MVSDMFRVTDSAITPRKAHLEGVVTQLPQAHRTAHERTTRALHEHLVGVADEAGLESSAIVLFRQRGKLHIGIDAGPAGDRLAASEFGGPSDAPNPVLRQAAMSAHPSFGHVYREHLAQEAGW